jgi:hypothetical protein
MQGHGGGGLSLERRFPIMSLTKQKLNTQSTTESEIVGADNFMPAICWTRYFMEAQGYQVQDTQFSWKRMKRHQAASVQSMSIFGISLFPIALTRVMYHWSGV